ncbi:MAG: twin-arginine translocase TatA/TatE family subunit [Planctomycetaceae bacterium]|nr:twin-arginine translocase TatA/TatE family subunit [Planctomycetaceae bacterium]
MSPLFAFGGMSNPIVYVMLAMVAFLLFGNRLPSVMRSLGRSVTEFKKGVAGIEDEINDSMTNSEKTSSNQNNTENRG